MNRTQDSFSCDNCYEFIDIGCSDVKWKFCGNCVLKFCNYCCPDSCPICNKDHSLTLVCNSENKQEGDLIEELNTLKNQNLFITSNTSSSTNPCSIEPGQIWRHFNNKEYQIIAIARSSHDPYDFQVVYKALYHDEKYGSECIWTRQLSEFNESVRVPLNDDINDDYVTVPRFIRIK